MSAETAILPCEQEQLSFHVYSDSPPLMSKVIALLSCHQLQPTSHVFSNSSPLILCSTSSPDMSTVTADI